MLIRIVFAGLFIASISFAEGTTPSGSGTSESPYQISSLDHLLWIATNSSSWGAYFEQTADIDASNTQYWDDSNDDASGGLYDDANDATSSGNNEGFPPIANTSDRFTGSYDGQNYSITNLTINRDSEDYIGLFCTVDAGTITNLGVSSASVDGDYDVGILAGYARNSTTIDNCWSSGTLTASHWHGGGLVGYLELNSIVENCYSDASVTGSGTDYYGGLVGRIASNSSVRYSYATGTVSGTNCVGGLVGYLDANSIYDCYATGSVSGNSYVGGLVGFIYSSTSINRCYSIGSVSGSSNLGGLVGGNHGTGTVSNSFWNTETSTQSSSTGGTGKTTSAMKTLSTFTDTDTDGLTSAWDFETNPYDDATSNDYWDLDVSATINNGYPYLSWQDGEDRSLPVLLSSFSAERVSGGIQLSWTTESEIENQGFILQRRESGSGTWSDVASYKNTDALLGQGSSTQRKKYTYLDADPLVGISYEYRLADVNFQGQVHWLCTVQTGAGADQLLPIAYKLYMAYPNPFNPATTIRYSLATAADVNLNIYDCSGRKIASLTNTHNPAGHYEVHWKGQDDAGKQVGAGVFLCRMITGDFESTIKLVYLK